MTNCVICHKALKIIMNENELVCVCFECIKKHKTKKEITDLRFLINR